MSPTSDDLDRPVEIPARVRRVVSLVPSLTEAIEVSQSGLVVGATDWCTHPLGLSTSRIGGTKTPRVEDIVALVPDVVIANDEENRPADIAALRAAGVAVWVTAPRSVPDAITSLDRMLQLACRLDRPAWLDQAAAVWAPDHDGPRQRAVVPIWRRPWMALGPDTFAADVLARLGVDNVVTGDRYPKLGIDAMHAFGPELVVLPDEPYAFGPDDGPEAFSAWDVPVRCVSGRHLTWYGPSLVDARDVLTQQLLGAPSQD